MTEEKKTNLKLEIQIDDETSQGAYINLAAVNHTEAEFIIDFIFAQPQVPKAKVRSRIITSPQHAKRLIATLHENLTRYETQFGEIRTESRLTITEPRTTSDIN
ncbi:MAG TPA: DUF3467 domain-containing protein [Geopsychrobacteraceae bacterium]|nr:DUF3467 domain-containing protein [Geopsychrobacteraceae bacterium]